MDPSHAPSDHQAPRIIKYQRPSSRGFQPSPEQPVLLGFQHLPPSGTLTMLVWNRCVAGRGGRKCRHPHWSARTRPATCTSRGSAFALAHAHRICANVHTLTCFKPMRRHALPNGQSHSKRMHNQKCTCMQMHLYTNTQNNTRPLHTQIHTSKHTHTLCHSAAHHAHA